jgi:hypothetical protein
MENAINFINLIQNIAEATGQGRSLKNILRVGESS